MGTKRVGLARVEALMENLKRDLAMGGANLSGVNQEVIRQTTADGWNDAAVTLTVAQSGALILLDKDEATTVTLPAITSADIGVNYTFVEALASDNLRSIITAYDDDCIIGGFGLHFDGASTDSTGTIAFKSIVVGDAIVRFKFDDNLANGGGGVGSTIKLTAIAAGNTGAGGGDKAAWLLTGNVVGVNEAATGAGFVATS